VDHSYNIDDLKQLLFSVIFHVRVKEEGWHMEECWLLGKTNVFFLLFVMLMIPVL